MNGENPFVALSESAARWRTLAGGMNSHGEGPEQTGPSTRMKIDIEALSEKLAADPRISDYDFWRSLKNLNNEIFQIANSNEPIPFDMLRWRAVIKQARSKRGPA